jgi:hypothetical protein
MSYNYTPLNQTATRLITTFGRDVTFTRQTQDAYNPATGVTSNTSSTYTKKCVYRAVLMMLQSVHLNLDSLRERLWLALESVQTQKAVIIW